MARLLNLFLSAIEMSPQCVPCFRFQRLLSSSTLADERTIPKDSNKKALVPEDIYLYAGTFVNAQIQYIKIINKIMLTVVTCHLS
jgi:hypothetical protein